MRWVQGMSHVHLTDLLGVYDAIFVLMQLTTQCGFFLEVTLDHMDLPRRHRGLGSRMTFSIEADTALLSSVVMAEAALYGAMETCLLLMEPVSYLCLRCRDGSLMIVLRSKSLALRRWPNQGQRLGSRHSQSSST